MKQADKNVVKLKQPSAECAYESIGVQLFKSVTSLSPTAEKVASLRKFLDSSNSQVHGDAPEFIIFGFYFSNFFRTEYTYVISVNSLSKCIALIPIIQVFQRKMKIDSSGTGQDPALDRAFSRFLKVNIGIPGSQVKFLVHG